MLLKPIHSLGRQGMPAACAYECFGLLAVFSVFLTTAGRRARCNGAARAGRGSKLMRRVRGIGTNRAGQRSHVKYRVRGISSITTGWCARFACIETGAGWRWCCGVVGVAGGGLEFHRVPGSGDRCG